MNEEKSLIISSTVDLDSVEVSDQTISKINQAFSRFYEEQREETIGLLRQLPSVIEVLDKLVTGKRYQALVPPKVWKQMQAGTVKWDRYADRLFGAVIRDVESGEIICHVKLQEVSPKLLSSIHQLAVQRTLVEIIQRLEVIDQKLTNVLQGQRNDRLAIIESGVDLYLQAMAATNAETRHHLLMSAIDKLNEGREKLTLSLKSEIQFIDRIPRSFWQMILYSPFKDISEEVEEKARPVQEAFQAILRASYVLASAYQALGEPKSLQVSLQPLKEMLIEVGTKGAEIARWLPYNASVPPEELWHNSLLQLADDVTSTNRELEVTHTKAVEIVFEASEVRGGRWRIGFAKAKNVIDL